MTYPAVPLTNPWVTGYVNATTMYNNTTLPLNEIQAVLANYGAGSVGHAVLGSSTVYNATGGNICSFSAAVIAGRKYAVTASFTGTQSGAPTIVTNYMVVNGTAVEYMQFQSAGASTTLYGTCVYLYIPGTSGTQTFYLSMNTSAGTMTINPGPTFLLVQDLGTI